MSYYLYQIQLETKDRTFVFEIGTNNCDALQLAEACAATKVNELCLFHLGAYDCIGVTKQKGIVSFREIED